MIEQLIKILHHADENEQKYEDTAREIDGLYQAENAALVAEINATKTALDEGFEITGELKAENERLREGLEYYARDDDGYIARQALAGKEG